jgi:hypothetical protein
VFGDGGGGGVAANVDEGFDGFGDFDDDFGVDEGGVGDLEVPAGDGEVALALGGGLGRGEVFDLDEVADFEVGHGDAVFVGDGFGFNGGGAVGFDGAEAGDDGVVGEADFAEEFDAFFGEDLGDLGV